MNHRPLRDEMVIPRRCGGFTKMHAIPLGFGPSLGSCVQTAPGFEEEIGQSSVAYYKQNIENGVHGFKAHWTHI